MKGKLIVIYGINNLGKTTQAEILVEKLKEKGRSARYLKYPIYDIQPSGRFINQYLREDNPYHLSPREFQTVQALNRQQYQPVLEKTLEGGSFVVAEDYWGTGVAWGMGSGVEKKFLLEINSQFQIEDLAFLFEGERFREAIESNHSHETDEALMARVAEAHSDLADEFNWVRINANQSVEKVSDDIWERVKQIL